jgi:hypothetical protein
MYYTTCIVSLRSLNVPPREHINLVLLHCHWPLSFCFVSNLVILNFVPTISELYDYAV